MAKTILVANSKGGVGKTTIASELAYAAQNSGLKFDYYDLGSVHISGSVI